MGDPLACPWAPRGRVVLHGLGAAVLRDPCRVRADVEAGNKSIFESYLYLLNEKVVSRSRFLDLDPRRLREGKHTIRAIAYSSGLVRGQLFTQRTIEIKHRRGSVREGK